MKAAVRKIVRLAHASLPEYLMWRLTWSEKFHLLLPSIPLQLSQDLEGIELHFEPWRFQLECGLKVECLGRLLASFLSAVDLPQPA